MQAIFNHTEEFILCVDESANEVNPVPLLNSASHGPLCHYSDGCVYTMSLLGFRIRGFGFAYSFHDERVCRSWCGTH